MDATPSCSFWRSQEDQDFIEKLKRSREEANKKYVENLKAKKEAMNKKRNGTKQTKKVEPLQLKPVVQIIPAENNEAEATNTFESLSNMTCYQTNKDSNIPKKICNRPKKKKKNKVTTEDKKRYEREKKRKQREKLKQNPVALGKAQEYEKNRSKRRREEGKLKNISQMNEREKRLQRKKWRECKRKLKEKKENEKALEDYLKDTSPPSTPPIRDSSRSEHQAVSGRRRVRRDRAKAYRMMNFYQNKLKNSEALVEKWKKKCYRKDKKDNKNKSPTPRKKVKELLTKGQQAIKKRLIFTEALTKQLKDNSAQIKNHQEKQLFYKAITGPYLRKYRVLGEARPFLKTSCERKYRCKTIDEKGMKISFQRKKRGYATSAAKKMNIIRYLEEDINSSLTPGKKDIISRKKIKCQKRYLNDSMKNLFKNFVKKYGANYVSYSLFCKNRPFWIVEPQINKRNTCLCMKHENVKLFTSKLYEHKLLKTKNIPDLINSLCCESAKEGFGKKECFYGECRRCKNKKEMTFESPIELEDEDVIHLYQWRKVKEEIIDKKKQKRTVNKTVKQKISLTISKLKSEFNLILTSFLKHSYNISHQYKSLKKLKSCLTPQEAVLVIDFSENYEAKYKSEVQSAHFGGSKPQITVHTGVCYTLLENKIVMKQFASVSNDLNHGATAVWAHITPVIEWIKGLNPNIHSIHIQSDGPTSQYKNKTNFYLITCVPKMFNYLKEITWNFSEPGHGKGPADGVGGQVKRYADKCVLYGRDILNADDLYDQLNSSSSNLNVKIFKISSDNIMSVESYIKHLELKPIPKTLLVRQVVWLKEDVNKLWLRDLSCFTCLKICRHHGLIEPYKFAVKCVGTYDDLLKKQVKTKEVDQTVTVDINEGSWVAVIYDDQWYPGIVESVSVQNMLSVSFMARTGEDKFFWPETPDVQTLHSSGIMCRMKDPPYPVSNRHFKVDGNFDDIMDRPSC